MCELEESLCQTTDNRDVMMLSSRYTTCECHIIISLASLSMPIQVYTDVASGHGITDLQDIRLATDPIELFHYMSCRHIL